MDCIFCGIVSGSIPSSKVYEDELCVAFRDLNPQAPVHVLVVPKKHIASLDEVSAENAADITAILTAIPGIASSLGVAGGYRVITNIGENGGQTVKHLHFHILGGVKLSERLN